MQKINTRIKSLWILTLLGLMSLLFVSGLLVKNHKVSARILWQAISQR